ncbi:hypothetical protein GH714_036425 [Hevea brasiliensis]|uniref:ENT domain-containing protein n=1 Tax=Hevea brasiliensis TaxID=3981 RepID=A0A6A6KNE1_HEVBR|nr:hypothetical protein GH714_036425 [Hevea brasiliensis]
MKKEGTDDDLPPHQNTIPKGERVVGNGRSVVGSAAYSRMHTDMEAQIHHLEQEAYSAVLRAFKAQSDAISWEKEGLITELRKELRVSDDQHRELLTKVNGDEIIRRIRQWRQAGGHQTARSSASQPVHDVVHSPSVSGSHKKQKTSQMLDLHLGLLFLPLSLAGSTNAWFVLYEVYAEPFYRSCWKSSFVSHSSSGALAANEHAEPASSDPLIGRKVWTRWPEDNSFYEAVITDYNPAEGRHALVYDMNTVNETWEWVNLKEISPEDIQWEGVDPGISLLGAHGGPGHGIKKSMRHVSYPSGGRGRGSIKGESRREFLPTQNGFTKKVSNDIELFNTETLVQEVEKVFALSHPDSHELEKAKRMLKEHEQALVEAIARLADASDGESGNEYMHA